MKRKDGIVAKRLRGKYGQGSLSDLLEREAKETMFTLNPEEREALCGDGLEVETPSGRKVFDIPSSRLCGYLNISRKGLSFHTRRMELMREYMYYRSMVVFSVQGFLYFKLLKEIINEPTGKKDSLVVTSMSGNRIDIRTRKNRNRQGTS